MNKIKPKRKKKSETSRLKTKADSVFSRYIRLKYSSKDGFCQCVTCKRISHWKKIQAGHYIERNVMRTRYDETNVHPQCFGCNSKHMVNGRKHAHAQYICDTYGQEKFIFLLKEGNTIFTSNLKIFLTEIIERYSPLVKKLEEEKGQTC